MELRHLLVILLVVVTILRSGVTGDAQDRKYLQDEHLDNEGVLGTIRNGFKMAGKFLGLDEASGVANLVAEAFGEAKNPSLTKSSENETSWGKKLITGLLRTLSLDTGKIGAIVLNAIVFLAQLLTSSIVPNNPALPESPRKVRDGSPIEWILQNPTNSVKTLIETAQDDKLIDYTIDTLQENSKGTDSSCLKLLICKMAPFVWKMQKALAGMKSKFEFENGTHTNIRNDTIDNTRTDDNKLDKNKNNDVNKNEDSFGSDVNNDNNYISNDDALFRQLPEMKEFIEHGKMCENKYDECRLID